MCKRAEMESLVDSSGVFVAATGQYVPCENPLCHNRAVVKDQATGQWLCQACHDEVYDMRWSVGLADSVG